MNTQYWGKSGWKFLHAITYAYPDQPSKEDKAAMSNLFQLLCLVLPCKKCQEHWAENLKKYPVEPHLDSRESLTKWLIDMHNRVNQQTGKPVVPAKKVQAMYSQWQQQTCACQDGFTTHSGGTSCVSPTVLKLWLLIGILLMIIAALGYYIFICRKM